MLILRGLPASPNILGALGHLSAYFSVQGPQRGLDEYLLEKQSGGGGLGKRVPSLPGHSQLHPGTRTITDEGWTRPPSLDLDSGRRDYVGGRSHGVSWRKGPHQALWFGPGHSLVASLGLPREHHYLC